MSKHITFTENERKYLSDLADRCEKFSREHRQKAAILKKVSYGISIPLILTNVATLIVNAWGGDNNSTEIKVTTMAVLGINAISSGLKSYLKVDEKIQHNIQKAISCEKLTEKIEISLASRNPKFNFDQLAEEKINIIENNDTLEIPKESSESEEKIQVTVEEVDEPDKELKKVEEPKNIIETTKDVNVSETLSRVNTEQRNDFVKELLKNYVKDYDDISMLKI